MQRPLEAMEAREFYTRYFDAQVAFDAGWYLSLALPGGGSLSFQEPGGGGEMGHPDPAFGGVGLILNLVVSDVDAEYRRLVDLGLTPANPPTDNPLGFWAFEAKDPSGITLFLTTVYGRSLVTPSRPDRCRREPR